MTDKLLRHIFELCSHDYYILFWLQVPHHTLHHCMEVEVVAFIWMVFHAVENEQALINCSHRGIGVHSCTHSEDAGVMCLGKLKASSYNIINNRIIMQPL